MQLDHAKPTANTMTQAIRPNKRNPWTRRLVKSATRYRLKQILRGAHLNHSFFTKRRTKARTKNYREALSKISKSHGAPTAIEIMKIWGNP